MAAFEQTRLSLKWASLCGRR